MQHEKSSLHHYFHEDFRREKFGFLAILTKTAPTAGRFLQMGLQGLAKHGKNSARVAATQAAEAIETVRTPEHGTRTVAATQAAEAIETC